MLLYTCERLALRVGVTEHLHREENRGAHVFYRWYKIGKNKQKEKETGKIQPRQPQMSMFLMAGQSGSGEQYWNYGAKGP